MSGHRPRRDTASNAKEKFELEREVHKLRRQVSRLSKQLNKRMATEPVEPDPEPAPLETAGMDCPSCAGPLTTVNLGVKTLKACKGCGWRKIVQ